jgi:hypothetical protein
MLSSPYFLHALYSIACLSISINLVGTRRFVEEDKSRVQARISLLESVKEQLSKRSIASLQDDDDVGSKELERLMKLANKTGSSTASASAGTTAVSRGETDKVLGDDVSWGDIFAGRAPKVVGKEEMSRWEKEDLEKCAYTLLRSEQFVVVAKVLYIYIYFFQCGNKLPRTNFEPMLNDIFLNDDDTRWVQKL